MSDNQPTEKSNLLQAGGLENPVYNKGMEMEVTDAAKTPVEEKPFTVLQQEQQGFAPHDPMPARKGRSPKERTTNFIRKTIKMKTPVDEDGNAMEVPTTCFGDVEFRGAARRSMSKYLRLSNDTKPEDVYRLMIKYWKMDEPRLLISVTGGAKSFALDPILKQNFTVGLSQIAQTPGCWVISGGTNAGVMKHVGDALQGSNACVGIATWGILTKKNMLEPESSEEGAYVQKTRMYEIGSWLTESGAFLDNNHSHFLLVDNGTEGKFGVEIPFRGALEKYIMSKAMARHRTLRKLLCTDDANIQSVPTVLLVLEGGPGTLGTVIAAVAGEPSVPVVLVNSSGRACDLLVYAINCADEIMKYHEGHEEKPWEHIHDERHVHPGLFEMVKEILGNVAPLKFYKQVIQCLTYKDSFTVSAVGSEMKIDDAIFEALLKDKTTKAYRQLQLSLVWNRADLARDKIFRSMVKWDGDAKELQYLFIMALAMNNCEFVELLLEYGVSVSSFLTNELLEFLYGYRSYDKSSPLRYEYNPKDYKAADRQSENYKTYKRLCSYDDLISIDSVCIPRKNIIELMHELCSSLIKIGNERFLEDMGIVMDEAVGMSKYLGILGSSLDISVKESSKTGCGTVADLIKASTGAQGKFEFPFRELFFWAVLNNMEEMANIFWRRGHEHMIKALIATHISNVLADRRASQQDINSRLLESAAFFRTGAKDLLDACYKDNDEATGTLITSQFNQFPGIDILKVAVASENLDFISHYSVQTLIEDIWVGSLKDREVGLFKVLLCWFLPPLISTLEFRTKEEIRLKVRTEQEYEEEMEEELEAKEETEINTDNEEEPLAVGSKKGQQERDAVARGMGTSLTFCEKLKEFYTTTPVVKFVTHTMAYFIYLILFSYTSLTTKEETMPTVIEWLVIVTAFAYFVAEIYQVIQVDAPTAKAQLLEWSSSLLNLFDATVIAFFFVALGLRLNPATRQVGHLLYNIDCGMWWLRLLSILVVWPSLGPYLVMIKRMLADLVQFMAVLFIFLIAYGVTSRAILEPSKDPTIKMLSGPIWQPFFHIFGELFVERDSEDGTTRFGTKVINSYDEYVVWVLLALYMLIANILLLNVLIAVFNDRYVEVQAQAKEYWQYTRFGLIMEYSDRHFLFAPFSIFGHIAIMFKWMCARSACCQKEKKEVDVSGLQSKITLEQQEGLLEFECDCMTKMQKTQETSITKTIEEMAENILEEIDTMKSEMQVMKEKVSGQASASKATPSVSE